jgi:hypothetical protein
VKGRAWLAGALAIAAPTVAHADDGDGVYGRFSGDLELRAHAGVGFAQGGPSFAANVTALYISSVGIYVNYMDAAGSTAPTVPRSVSTGLHLSPLFLIRGALNGEHGPAFVDLLIDSLGFELGPAWSATRSFTVLVSGAPPAMPQGTSSSFDETPGIEAALSLSVPLFARASGLFLGVRGALRWRPSDFAPTASTSVADRGGYLMLTLGWHQVLDVHLVDAGDRVVR